MRPDRTLTRAARLTGAAVCLLLALSGLGWILRDLSVAREPVHVWWLWAGMPGRPGRGLVWATSLNDLFLCCVQFAAALAVLRSRAAAGALVAVGAVTVALRVPSLWIIREEWLPAAGG
ncbi:MAG TPA: hypothetical protein DEQ61_09200, partial [Streptomyces sp.]|nr:hypothetical protein [Streptomyces sp.]